MQRANFRGSIALIAMSLAAASREAFTQVASPIEKKYKHSGGSVQISLRERGRSSKPRGWWLGGNVEGKGKHLSPKGERRLARNRELLSRMS